MQRSSKLFLIFFFVIFSFNPLFAQEGISVSVSNLRNNKGHVLISLFKECEGYPDKPEKAFRKVRVEIKDKSALYLFTQLPNGNYSIAVLHDENDDLKMNTNFFGIPKEGYGFSNNVMGTFGPPSCSRAGFSHYSNTATALMIRARYGW